MSQDLQQYADIIEQLKPMVNEPVAIAWDGNGKMYVAQMDTYMQNVDAVGEDEPISQIKLLVDLDGDGNELIDDAIIED